jgi:osmoprotectant transport system substrate-binding protein
LAQLYGQVLESHSYDVFYNFGLDTREETFAALQSGRIDFLPDFTGEVLDQLYPEAQVRSPFDVTAAARRELTAVGLTMLPASPAENGSAFVTTKEFAETNGIESIGQIIPIEKTVTIGAEPGFESSESGRATLKRIYAVNHWKYVPIAGDDPSAAIDALATGTAQIVVMVASSPLIKLNDLVVISDPSHALPADNLAPIMSSTAYPRAIATLVDGLTQALTTEQLRNLAAQRAAETAPSDWRIARNWLIENELLDPKAPRR